jgi:tetratricopeptide (TPR) repeat protein
MHLPPLDQRDALTLLAARLGKSLNASEALIASQLCDLVGNVPLGIELLAATLRQCGLRIEEFAPYATTYLIDHSGELRQGLDTVLRQTTDALYPSLRMYYQTLLATLLPGFSLKTATQVFHAVTASDVSGESDALPALASSGAPTSAVAASALAALTLLRRHSLIELSDEPQGGPGPRYQIPALLRKYVPLALPRLKTDIEARTEAGLVNAARDYLGAYRQQAPRIWEERELLMHSLGIAWRRQWLPQVVALSVGLIPIVGNFADAQPKWNLLHWGMYASQRLHDKRGSMRMLNLLGICHFYRGSLALAQATWRRCIALLDDDPLGAIWLSPWANLVLEALARQDLPTAASYCDLLIRRQRQRGSHLTLAHAHYIAGNCARWQGKHDEAYTLLQRAQRMFAEDGQRDLQVEVEIARAQGDFQTASAYLEELAPTLYDRYAVADIWLEQAQFAHQQGLLEEARALGQKVVRLAPIDATHLIAQGQKLLAANAGAPRRQMTHWQIYAPDAASPS